MVCLYCKWFQNSSKVLEKGIQRYCSVRDRFVLNNDKICRAFVINKYFYCNKHCNRIDVLVCMNHRRTKHQGCTRCKQGKLIEKLYDFKPTVEGKLFK